MVRLTDRPDMGIAVDWDIKRQTKPNALYDPKNIFERREYHFISCESTGSSHYKR